MKKKLTMNMLATICIICISFFSSVTFANEEYLYDASGNVSAVVDTPNSSNNTILYAPNGTPIGYMDIDNAVYTFSGGYIGWYSDGILWDNNGYIISYAERRKPPIITTDLTRQTVILNNQNIPAIVPPVQPITTVPATYTYQMSPTPLNEIVTVTPAN